MSAVLEGREGVTPRSGMDLDITLDQCIDSKCNNTTSSQTAKSATSENPSLVKLLHLVRKSNDQKAMDKLCKWVPKA